MSEARKFTFDTEFRADTDVVSAAARARRKQTFTTEELEGMIARARQEGTEAAQVRARESIDRTVAALVISLRSVLDQSHAEVEAVREEAAGLALAAARKIAHAALAALPEGDVEEALRQAMHQAIAEPRITLRAGAAVIEAMQDKVEAIAHEEGYDGRVMIAIDPALAGADCRIEWRGGGSERSEAAITAAVETIIARRFTKSPDSERSKG
jgi:flagellar assembly protein FliH